MAAKDRKRKEPSITKEQASSRRAGRVITHRVQPTSPVGTKLQDAEANLRRARQVQMAKPVGLSVEARFMEMKPDGYHVLDWWRLFTIDESQWDDILEEVLWDATSNDGLEEEVLHENI